MLFGDYKRMAASVKVAVRVRPFNEREIKMNSECVIAVDGNKTRLLNLKPQNNDMAEAKDFTFDYSYWSHNTESHHFASQEKVYTDLGSSVVSSGLQGYNACVFAYGQTGSGKTYTMMGSQNNPGLIPRICKALFSSMEKGRESGTTYKVEVSYLEIYNERVKDLLTTRSSNNAKEESLKVREHSKNGPYVENLSKQIVTQYSEVQDLMQRGNSFRTTAATNMNDTSSRSHAIFTLTVVQAKLQADVPLETRSKINLVDLAGSERADATGATGQRLKEGSHINKSLVTLGTVISTLADQGCKGNKKAHIPYRDSVLTFLLKDSLGGNSKTIMIATISPADVNFGETLGTLRYANRAKNIINKPTINEDPNVKLIRELRSEIMMLRNMVGGDNINIESAAGPGEVSIRATLSLKEAQEKELTDKWTEKWRQTQCILEEQRTLELRKAGESGRGVVLDSERPHLVLYDDDLGSTGLILYHLNDEITTIGASHDQDIRLEGQGMEKEHCVIRLQGQKATLERKPEADVIVNDMVVKDTANLIHGAMIVVGTSHIFRYNDPQEAARIRKQGNRSSMNLSRLSFLSRSNTDLLRASDTLPDVVSDGSGTKVIGDRRAVDDSIIRKHQESNAECCEISTQTSYPGQSNTSTRDFTIADLVVSNNEPKSSLTNLEVENQQMNNYDGNSTSCDTTPASDTFYTATSDVSDQLISDSPLKSQINDSTSYKSRDISLNEIASPIRHVGHGLPRSPGAINGATTSTPKRGDFKKPLDPIEDSTKGCRPKKDLSDRFENEGGRNSSTVSTEENHSSRPNFSEGSELIPADCDLMRLNDVLFRLHAEDGKENKSIEQQQKELKELQNYYTALENKLLDVKLGYALSNERGEKESEGNKWLQDLPIEILLKEERVVLLIEREVQRRLMVEVSNLEKCQVVGCAGQSDQQDKMVQSSSASSLRSIPRTLSSAEFRLYSSLSEFGNRRGPSGGIMYINRASDEDDLLFSPVPLDSQLVDSFGISISIPFFELRGKGSVAHCVYQVSLSVDGDSWSIFRRYSKFRELHLVMCHKYGAVVQDMYFPPRRIFGNHSIGVIQQRRKELETYLRQLISLCSEMEGSPLCDITPSRQLLARFSHFFNDDVNDLSNPS